MEKLGTAPADDRRVNGQCNGPISSGIVVPTC